MFLVCRYSIIRSCCQWNSQHRLSMSELIRKLQAGEKSANGRTVLVVPEPLDIEKYLREAGYGEAYNYAVLWLAESVISQEYTAAVVAALWPVDFVLHFGLRTAARRKNSWQNTSSEKCTFCLILPYEATLCFILVCNIGTPKCIIKHTPFVRLKTKISNVKNYFSVDYNYDHRKD